LPEDGLANYALANNAFVSFAKRAAATLFFTFFPADCRICGIPLLEISRIPVCQACISSVRPLQGSYCAVCGEDLHLRQWHEDVPPAGDEQAGHDEASLDESAPAKDDARCMLCQRTDPPYERAVPYGSYDGPLRDLIHLLKFQQVRPAGNVLGRMLAQTISALEPTMPVGKIIVVPVPLYSRKRVQRGFNQAEAIATSALRQLKRPKRFELCTAVLRRSRETASQIGLTRHQRRENLRGAFAVSDPTRIAKSDILLVDDVFTTGTTAAECARVLLRAGAARVWVATVARTLKLNYPRLFMAPEIMLENSRDNFAAEGSEDRERIEAQG
jgi:ComF family protein